VALSRHDPLALYWLIQHAFLAGDVDGVLHHADALLRAQPDFAPTVAPMLTALTADETTRPRIVAALAASPPWRDGFLAELPALATDPRLPFALLRELARGPTPPTVPRWRRWPPRLGAPRRSIRARRACSASSRRTRAPAAA